MKDESQKASPGSGAPFSLRSLAVMISLLFLLSGSAGCLDVALIRDVVNEIEGDDGIEYRWMYQLSVTGNFDLDFDTPPTNYEEWFEKMQRFYDKMSENLSDPGPDTPQKVRQILGEEGVSMKPKEHTFYLPPNTLLANLEYNVNFTSLFTSGITPGYFEIKIKKPDGTPHGQQEKVVYDSNSVKGVVPLGTDTGYWTIEISGTGLSQIGVSQIYSGEYSLLVRAKVEKG